MTRIEGSKLGLTQLDPAPPNPPASSSSGITDYHAKYLAHELTKRCASDSVEKLASVLADAQVDLNPHQVEAALFAFRSPFSKGAILADEVGLGKTIEAGPAARPEMGRAQAAPAGHRAGQPAQAVEPGTGRQVLPAVRHPREPQLQRRRPRRQPQPLPAGRDHPLLLSVRAHQGALSAADALGSRRHRRGAPAAQRLQEHQQDRHRHQAGGRAFPKVLLTATPLQNSLLELYGLVSIIDDFAFGDLKSYRTPLRPPRQRRPTSPS